MKPKTHPLEITQLSVRRSPTFELVIPDLQVPAGTILGVAGPNGSGKSTLIAAIVGLLQPSQGGVKLAGQAVGQDLKATKAIVGYIPDDEEWFIKELTAREYLGLLAQIYAEAGAPADSLTVAYRLAEKLYFTAFDQQLESLSHGNKKKVQLIAGLMHQPAIIVVDELRNGLDPLAIIAAEQIVRAEAERGACVVAATHDLWWAQRVAHDLLLLIDGQVAVHDRTSALVKQYGSVEQLFMSQMGLDHERV